MYRFPAQFVYLFQPPVCAPAISSPGCKYLLITLSHTAFCLPQPLCLTSLVIYSINLLLRRPCCKEVSCVSCGGWLLGTILYGLLWFSFDELVLGPDQELPAFGPTASMDVLWFHEPDETIGCCGLCGWRWERNLSNLHLNVNIYLQINQTLLTIKKIPHSSLLQ